MFSISADQLNKLNVYVEKGDTIVFTHDDGTKEVCKLQLGESVAADGKKTEDSLLGFVTLTNGKSYLCSINGKLLSVPYLKKKV